MCIHVHLSALWAWYSLGQVCGWHTPPVVYLYFASNIKVGWGFMQNYTPQNVPCVSMCGRYWWQALCDWDFWDVIDFETTCNVIVRLWGSGPCETSKPVTLFLRDWGWIMCYLREPFGINGFKLSILFWQTWMFSPARCITLYHHKECLLEQERTWVHGNIQTLTL